MTRFLRTLIGALVGSLLVLLINPSSRPFMTGAFTDIGESTEIHHSPWIAKNNQKLPPPTNLKIASLWMDVGAEKIRFPRSSPKQDFQKLLRVAQIEAEAEPQNAFWLQMRAIILDSMGDHKQALQEWIRASHRSHWNDYQSARLESLVREIESNHRHQTSWSLYAVNPYRSILMAMAIQRYAHVLIKSHGLEDEQSLRVRYATLINGSLMRAESRSLSVGNVGFDIVEMASYPPDIEAFPTQKTLMVARYTFMNALRTFGLTNEAATAKGVFDDNDAWLFIPGRSRPSGQFRFYSLFMSGTWSPNERFRLYSLGSVLTATIPSCLLVVSILGGVMWFLGGLLLRYPVARRFLHLPIAPILGVALGIAVYALLRLSMVALATSATFAFATFAPRHERTNPSEFLGPFFRFMLVVIGGSLVLVVGAFFMGLTAPALELHTVIGVPSDFVYGSGVLVGLALVDIGLLFLVAPTWAIVRKLNTAWVFAVGLRDLGKGLCLGAAILAVISGPVSVYSDRRLYDLGTQLLQNETVYYINLSK